MRIGLLGDTALMGIYDRLVADDLEEKLQAVKEYLSDCDFVIANLETPFTKYKKTKACKGVYLRSDPSNVNTLAYLGVTHVSLGNNHCWDYGKVGLADTLKILHDNKITAVGLNMGAALIQKGVDRVLLEGFCCYSANAIHYGNTPHKVAVLSKQNVMRFLEESKKKAAVPILSVHFGVEGVHYPSVEHISMFRELTQFTPFVLHGNHPHVIQGYELIGGSLLLYALGNLCFDSLETTSMRNTRVFQQQKNREHYVAKINVERNTLKEVRFQAFSGWPNGVMRSDDAVQAQLNDISKALALPSVEYNRIRKEALHSQDASSTAKNLQFYLDRLNWRYIGAYVNGSIHAKLYNKVFGECLK